ncbi:hypothetical protein COLO4_21441 [Corchorus olitorius]|uniref:Uncharacterized protein n=1 Tax=Corchorus olitorius TaxID=93759 RepID=A0A1R3IT97_9ROSI|nr:hypothetical protein COLO4_21441 [Corchorus olitorius]
MGSSGSSSSDSLLLHRDPFIASLADQFTSNNPHFIYLLKSADLEKQAPLKLPPRVAEFLPKKAKIMTLSLLGEHFINGNDPFTMLGPPGTATFFRKRWEENAQRKWHIQPRSAVISCSSSRAFPSDYIRRMAETSEAELILGAKYRVTHKAWLGKWEANKKMFSECRANGIDLPPRQSVDLMRSNPDSMDSIIAAIELKNRLMFEMLEDNNSFAVSLGTD